MEEDPCLQWARANPQIAQLCLQPPSSSSSLQTMPDSNQNNNDDCNFVKTFWNVPFQPQNYRYHTNRRNTSMDITIRQKWEDYWKWRQWDFSMISDVATLPLGQALTTRGLTTPLTTFAALGQTLEMWMGTNTQIIHPDSILEYPSASFISNNSTLPFTKTSNTLRNTNSVREQQQQQQQLRWCCIGARSEATLPMEYWNELLILLDLQYTNLYRQHTSTYCSNSNSTMHRPTLDIQIDFCGPEMGSTTTSTNTNTTTTNNTTTKRAPIQWSTKNKQSTMTLCWAYQGMYHDYHKKMVSNYDRTYADNYYHAFLLFNPGIGHPNLRDGWRPTLDILLERTRYNNNDNTATHAHPCIVMTAHSEYDATRDAAVIHEVYGKGNVVRLDYIENAFAARVQYQDPFLRGHTVRPNHYLGVIQF